MNGTEGALAFCEARINYIYMVGRAEVTECRGCKEGIECRWDHLKILQDSESRKKTGERTGEALMERERRIVVMQRD